MLCTETVKVSSMPPRLRLTSGGGPDDPANSLSKLYRRTKINGAVVYEVRPFECQRAPSAASRHRTRRQLSQGIPAGNNCCPFTRLEELEGTPSRPRTTAQAHQVRLSLPTVCCAQSVRVWCAEHRRQTGDRTRSIASSGYQAYGQPTGYLPQPTHIYLRPASLIHLCR